MLITGRPTKHVTAGMVILLVRLFPTGIQEGVSSKETCWMLPLGKRVANSIIIPTEPSFAGPPLIAIHGNFVLL